MVLCPPSIVKRSNPFWSNIILFKIASEFLYSVLLCSRHWASRKLGKKSFQVFLWTCWKMQIHSFQKELFAQEGDTRLVGSGKASQRKQCWTLKRITETEWESQKGFGLMERPLQQQGGSSRERQLVWGAWEWQTLCFSLGVCASEGGAPSATLFQNRQSTTVNEVTECPQLL